MSEPDVVKFSCYQCSQHIRAFREHIGQNILCPSCGTRITVPAGSQITEEPEELVVSRRFTDEELNLIRREGTGAYEAYIGSAVREYWQFSLLADLLTKRLAPLQQTVLDIMRKQEVWDREVVNHGPFVKFVNHKASEFFGILYQLDDRMTEELNKVIYQDGLEPIIVFANQIAAIIMRLKRFHESIYEQSLPAEYPYADLQGLMKSWAPFCWQSLKNAIDELKNLGVRKQDDSSWKALQMSFAPPTMSEFFYHQMYLPEPEAELFGVD